MKSRLYAVILAVIVLCYGFFFASRFIFHEDRSLLYTELNTTQKLSETVSLTLKKWVYSPKDKAMTVMFSVANNGIEKLELNWSTTERHTKKFMSIETGTAQSRLSTELSYPFGNMVVVSISNVPKSFEEVALTLQLVQADESKTEYKRIVFYTNADEVEKVDTIGAYTANDYRIEYLQIERSDKQEKIKELTEANEKLQADNQDYQKTIDELIANEQFETAEEIEATNSKIQSYRRQIERNSEIIAQNKYEVEELKKAIEEINDAISKIENMDI